MMFDDFLLFVSISEPTGLIWFLLFLLIQRNESSIIRSCSLTEDTSYVIQQASADSVVKPSWDLMHPDSG